MDGWTDDELQERIETAPPLPDAIYTRYNTYSGRTSPEVITHNVFDLCQDTVVKGGLDYYLAPEARVLDICCGTGDLALALARERRGIVFGSDFCHPMLDAARQKAERRHARITLFEADAQGVGNLEG